MGGLDEAEVSVVWIKGRDEINNRNQKLSPCTVAHDTQKYTERC